MKNKHTTHTMSGAMIEIDGQSARPEIEGGFAFQELEAHRHLGELDGRGLR